MKNIIFVLVSFCLIYLSGCTKSPDIPPTPNTVPILTTIDVNSIASTMALSGGIITSDGGTPITGRGVVWDTTANPVITISAKTVDGTGVGNYTSKLTELIAHTAYFVRAYAINGTGTAYGNEISFTTSLSIGNNYQGGIVFYILQPGDMGYVAGEIHGLIAAPHDQSDTNGIRWYNWNYVMTAATGTLVGTGKINTNAIINVQGDTSINYAAGLARAYNGGGYSDWFLPSKEELYLMYTNLIAKNIGAFGAHPYWSSSQSNEIAAWCQFFNVLYQTNTMISTNYVRAARYF